MEYLDPASNKFPSMVRKGYFLITLFYPPGFCGEPCIYLSLPPFGSGFWNSESCLATHLGSSHHILPSWGPLFLLSLLSTMATDLISNLRPSAGVLLPITPTLAKVPLIAGDSRLFPGSLSELQGKPKPLLPGSALFSEELPWRLPMHLLHQDPDSPSIAPSMWGLFHATRQKVPPQTKSPRGPLNTQPLPSNSSYIPRPCRVFHNILSLLLCSETYDHQWKETDLAFNSFLIKPAVYQSVKFSIYQPG